MTIFRSALTVRRALQAGAGAVCRSAKPVAACRYAWTAAGNSSQTRREEENLVPAFTFLPESPSYFTTKSKYNDTLIGLENLLRKYETLPTLPADDVPLMLWTKLDQFKSLLGDYRIKPVEFRRVIYVLNRLNAIKPDYMTDEIKAVLAQYKREEFTRTVVKTKERTVDEYGRAYALGKRKEAVAKVWVVEGEGNIMVNGKPLADMFVKQADRESVVFPLVVTSRLPNYNVWAVVKGGGTTGQAEAIQLGISRALMIHDTELKLVLRKAGLVTRDPRVVERKKPGHKKARKMPTWVKR
ncbi:37S ribosomal protein S9, mitochondrial [Saitoella coloradoensis]